MTDRRTTEQLARRLSGRCLRCGDPLDRVGANCLRCHAIIQSRNRQRYRPGKPAAQWTACLIARASALALRGVL